MLCLSAHTHALHTDVHELIDSCSTSFSTIHTHRLQWKPFPVWLTAVMEVKISLINWEDGWEWERLPCSISPMPLWHRMSLLQRFVNTAEQHLFDCTHGLHFAKWYFVIAEKWASWINFDTQLFAIPSVTLEMWIVVQHIGQPKVDATHCP